VKPFIVEAPATVSEAVDRLHALGPTACLLAGGTALLPRLKRGDLRPAHLVWLGQVHELRGIHHRDGELVIGALTSLHQLTGDPQVARLLPALHALLPRVANVRIRTMATLGGNLAQRDAGFDPPVLLAALGTRASLVGPGGVRTVEVTRLADSDGLATNEVLTEVAVPIPAAGTGAAVVKHSPRSWTDRSTVTAAAMVAFGPDERVQAARITLGGVGSRIIHAVAAQRTLLNSRLTVDRVAEASRAAATDVRPSADVRGGEAYKRAMAEVFVRRALITAAQAARQRKILLAELH